jgi:hypothetical protein
MWNMTLQHRQTFVKGLLIIAAAFALAACKSGGSSGSAPQGASGPGDPDPPVVSGNQTPTADAGADRTVTTGSLITLSGEGADPDGDPLSFTWSLASEPPGAQTAMTNANRPNMSFRPSVAGAYRFELTAHDGSARSAVDNVTVTSRSGGTVSGHAYLDDANKPVHSANGASSTSHHLFPRVYQHENIGGSSSEALSKYMFIDVHGTGFAQMETVQSTYSPETMLLRHISGREYQSYTTNDDCYVTMGVAFAATGPVSQGGPSSAGCAIYAGHWLYKAGTPLIQSVTASALTLKVADASKVTPGQYVVIYNAPAGSFNNAEHVKVTARDLASNTITLQARGYKSTAVAHGVGSIVAQHVLGQGADSRLWAFNFSSVSPRDGNNKTFGQFYADWLQKNLTESKNGETTTAEVAGIVFDTDFYFDLTTAAPDTNNDLVRDDGRGASGVNWLGEGLDAFYRMVSDRLPDHYLLAGVHDARGFDSTNGAQMENWLDYGNGDFNPNPQYKQLNSMFSRYLFNMGVRSGAPLVHNLIKTPTRLYPGNAAPKPTSNAPARLGLALTLMDDAYFGTHTNLTADAWWDEYAVDVTPGSSGYGRAIAKTDISGIHQHRGWLGAPSGPFRRVYNEAEYAPTESLLYDGTFDANLGQWSSKGVQISGVSSDQLDGGGALSVSTMNPYYPNTYEAKVQSESLNLVNGREYTIAFAARSSKYREISVALGTRTEVVPLGPDWRRYVMAFKQTATQNTRLTFQVGRENTQVWLDSVYVFEGNANVFRRDFDHGIALANATPTSRTLQLDGEFRKINGSLDPAINDGATVSSVTLGPYDGLLLVRPH